MHCNEYLQLLSGHLDHTNSEKEEKRLQGHLKNCRHCRELLAQMEANDLLLNDDAIVPPADLTERIMTQVRKEPRKRRSYRRFVSYAAGGLAAAAMLTLVLTGRFSLPTSEKAANELPNPPVLAVTVYPETEEKDADEPDLAANAMNENVNDTSADGTGELTGYWPEEDASTDDGGVTDGAEEAVGEPTEPPTAADAPVPTEEPTVTVASSEAAPPEPTEAAPATEPPQCATEPTGEPAPPAVADTTEPVCPTTDDPVLPDLSSNRFPPLKRDVTLAKPEVLPDGPVLVIWDAADASMSSYQDLESVALKNLPVQTDVSLLFPRFLQALPLVEKSLAGNQLLTTEPEFTVTAYRTSYTTFNSVLLDFVGAYELSVYYPTTEGDYTQGLLLLVSKTTS